MPKEVRVTLSVFTAIVSFVLTLGIEISSLGSDALRALMMMSIVGLLVAAGGVGIAGAVGAAIGFLVYGATWFVQEAFDLHPSVASGGGQPPRQQTTPSVAQREGVKLALLRAELELSTGAVIEATCPICSGRLSVQHSAPPSPAVICCPCGACRREIAIGELR